MTAAGQLICGIHPVLEALAAGTRHFDRVVVAKGTRNRRVDEAVSRATQLGIPLRFEGRETLDRMAGGLQHQGLIAVVSAQAALALEDLLAELKDPGLVVALDGVEDPRNLGAILRTVEAAGASGVVLPQRHSAGLTEVVSRASAGAVEHVRVARVTNLAQALEAIKARGLWVVGFDASGSERWDTIDFKQPVALVFGGEGRGIRRLVREKCDHLAALPLFGQVASLNVSVVAGIALYEVIRQRGQVPSLVRPIPLASPRRSEEPLPVVSGDVADAEAEEAEEGPLHLASVHQEGEWGEGGGPEKHGRRFSRLINAGAGRRGGRRRNRHAGGGRPPQAAPVGQQSQPPAPAAADGQPSQAPGATPSPQRRGRRRRRRRRPGGGGV